MMLAAWKEKLAQYIGKENLVIGCGVEPEMSAPGQNWTSLDMNPRTQADVIHNLHDLPLPFEAERFDTVLASHVLEHIEQGSLLPVVYDIARILKPGGHFIVIVPYGSNDAAWENPHHRQRFTAMTFAYFDRRLYEAKGTAGTDAGQGFQYAVWAQMLLTFTPTKGWMGKTDEELTDAMSKYNNVIEEMQVVLRLESR